MSAGAWKRDMITHLSEHCSRFWRGDDWMTIQVFWCLGSPVKGSTGWWGESIAGTAGCELLVQEGQDCYRSPFMPVWSWERWLNSQEQALERLLDDHPSLLMTISPRQCSRPGEEMTMDESGLYLIAQLSENCRLWRRELNDHQKCLEAGHDCPTLKHCRLLRGEDLTVPTWKPGPTAQLSEQYVLERRGPHDYPSARKLDMIAQLLEHCRLLRGKG